MGYLIPSFIAKKKKKTPYREKPHYAIWQGLWLSLYSAKFYVDVGQRWSGFGFRYLFLLSLIAPIPLSLQEIHKTREFYDNYLIPASARLPTIPIKNGIVHFDKPMPYVIRDNAHERPLVVIDTTKPLKDFDESLSSAVIIVTKDYLKLMDKPGLKFKASEKQLEESGFPTKFSEHVNGYINAKEAVQMSENVKRYTSYVVYPMLVFVFFFCEILIVSIMANLANFICRSLFRFSAPYMQALRIGVVCSTPQVLLLIFSFFIDWPDPSRGLLLFCVYNAYFCFGAMVNKRATHQLVAAS